jgi:hypothetical protein
MKMFKGPTQNLFKPHPRYAEAAKAARALGMDVADDDYEKIDAMVENESEELLVN